jgi:rhodanese-related sulfurtransferase
MDRIRHLLLLGLLLWPLPALPLAGCGAPEPPPAAPVAGRLLIDVRDPATFADGHADGALNLQLGFDQLDARIGAYAPELSTPIALFATEEADLAEAAAILDARGYDDVVVADLPEGAGTDVHPCTIDAEELARRLGGEDPPVVLDVRSAVERRAGRIDGAIEVDPDEVPGLAARLDPARRYAAICESGWRSGQAASFLAACGLDACNVLDGMAGWRRLAASE